jgi:hypothetical protein
MNMTGNIDIPVSSMVESVDTVFHSNAVLKLKSFLKMEIY